MTEPRARRSIDGPVSRLVALLLGIGCFALIGLSWRDQVPDPVKTPLPGGTQLMPSAPSARPVADAGDCRVRKQAEMDKLKAEGKLTAEQSMIMRQAIAKECP